MVSKTLSINQVISSLGIYKFTQIINHFTSNNRSPDQSLDQSHDHRSITELAPKSLSINHTIPSLKIYKFTPIINHFTSNDQSHDLRSITELAPKSLSINHIISSVKIYKFTPIINHFTSNDQSQDHRSITELAPKSLSINHIISSLKIYKFTPIINQFTSNNLPPNQSLNQSSINQSQNWSPRVYQSITPPLTLKLTNLHHQSRHQPSLINQSIMQLQHCFIDQSSPSVQEFTNPIHHSITIGVKAISCESVNQPLRKLVNPIASINHSMHDLVI